MTSRSPRSEFVEEDTVLGPYVVSLFVRHAGVASLYLARHRETDQRVAIKVMLRAYAEHPIYRARFLREAELQPRLRAIPYVAQTIDHGLLPDGRPYLVREWIEGTLLETLLAELHERDESLHFAVATRYALDVARGLEALHARFIVHRDLKPGNIVIDEASDRPKLTELGSSADLGLPHVGSDLEAAPLLGTQDYASPEHSAGMRPNPCMDIWSFGAILLELYRPFHPRVDDSLQTHGIAPDFHIIGPRELKPTIRTLVLDCLSRDPTQRPTAHTLVQVLEAVTDRLRTPEIEIGREPPRTRSAAGEFFSSSTHEEPRRSPLRRSNSVVRSPPAFGTTSPDTGPIQLASGVPGSIHDDATALEPEPGVPFERDDDDTARHASAALPLFPAASDEAIPSDTTIEAEDPGDEPTAPHPAAESTSSGEYAARTFADAPGLRIAAAALPDDPDGTAAIVLDPEETFTSGTAMPIVDADDAVETAPPLAAEALQADADAPEAHVTRDPETGPYALGAPVAHEPAADADAPEARVSPVAASRAHDPEARVSPDVASGTPDRDAGVSPDVAREPYAPSAHVSPDFASSADAPGADVSPGFAWGANAPSAHVPPDLASGADAPADRVTIDLPSHADAPDAGISLHPASDLLEAHATPAPASSADAPDAHATLDPASDATLLAASTSGIGTRPVAEAPTGAIVLAGTLPAARETTPLPMAASPVPLASESLETGDARDIDAPTDPSRSGATQPSHTAQAAAATRPPRTAPRRDPAVSPVLLWTGVSILGLVLIVGSVRALLSDAPSPTRSAAIASVDERIAPTATTTPVPIAVPSARSDATTMAQPEVPDAAMPALVEETDEAPRASEAIAVPGVDEAPEDVLEVDEAEPAGAAEAPDAELQDPAVVPGTDDTNADALPGTVALGTAEAPGGEAPPTPGTFQALAGPSVPADTETADADPPDEVAPPAEDPAPAIARSPREKTKPAHETASCEARRRRAEEASRDRAWTEVLTQTKRAECWASSKPRMLMRLDAMLQLQRYAQCASEGARSSDPVLAARVERCRSLMTR